MLHGVGLQQTDMQKPQIGISSVWYEGNTCNMHLLELSNVVKQGVEKANMIGFRFNTIGVSDGISMGTDGMNYSLQSRDLIADSIETVMCAQWYDGNIALPGCDKNMPGCMMAIGRVNRPSIVVYGGTIRPGYIGDQKIDIVSAFQSYGEFLVGKINEEQRKNIVKKACPGAGACGGMYTANTMAVAIEAMGMSLPYSSSTPATDPKKQEECLAVGLQLAHLIEYDITPRAIMTKQAFYNAFTLVIALGGSTNAVLHLIAMAHAVDVDFTLEDCKALSDRIPYIADLKPSGQYVMEDLHHVGGTPAVMKLLLRENLIDGNCLTVTGKTIEANLSTLPDLDKQQTIIAPIRAPLKKIGHIRILTGNLAPGGAVGKITGKEGESFSGPAQVFDSEEAMLEALEAKKINKGSVIVIRYEGPKGGPGMPEMLTPTSALVGAGFLHDVALITDGRFSGGSHGFIVGHVVPEAQEGGPIALIKDGDNITIDSARGKLDVNICDEEMQKRKQAWVQPDYKVNRGTLRKYIAAVQPANTGCITDADSPIK